MLKTGLFSRLGNVVCTAGVIVFVLGVSACGPAQSRTPWAPSLRALDGALARNDLAAARRAAHDAYVATLLSASWEGQLAVGDAYRRLGEATHSRAEANATARKLYLDAFLLARQQGSLDGVLESAAAFTALGDDGVVQQCLIVARTLAARVGGGAPARVTAWAERLADRRTMAQITDADLF